MVIVSGELFHKTDDSTEQQGELGAEAHAHFLWKQTHEDHAFKHSKGYTGSSRSVSAAQPELSKPLSIVS